MDMSITRGPRAVGTPTAMGLVPKTASEEPCGATYSGHCDSTMPMKPSLASWRAQYLQRGHDQGSGLCAAIAAQRPPRCWLLNCTQPSAQQPGPANELQH